MNFRDFFRIGEGSRFRNNFLKVAKANLIAQALPLLAAPLLTRLYSPDDFGIVTLLFTVLSFFLTFSTWRVEWSVPNSESKREESGLVLIGYIFLVFSGLALTLVGYAYSNSIFQGPELSTLSPYLGLILLALVGEGAIQIAIGTHIRSADMGPVSIAAIIRTTVTTITSLLLGFADVGKVGLITGNISGIWLSAIVLYYLDRKKIFSLKTVKLNEVVAIWNKYKSECSISVTVSMINYGFLRVLPLSLAAVYSLRELGYYAIANKLAVIPIRLISKSVSQSFWAESSQLVKQDPARLRILYKKTLLRLSVISIIPALIFLGGPLYVGLIFGKQEWTQAGVILAAITPQTIGTLIIGSTNHLTVYGKQKYQLISDASTICGCLIWIKFATTFSMSFFATILGISVVTLCGYVFRFYFHLRANQEYADELQEI